MFVWRSINKNFQISEACQDKETQWVREDPSRVMADQYNALRLLVH